jgi:hypothetical protein
VTAISSFLFTIPIGGVVVVLVMAHYFDFAAQNIKIKTPF